ncbi:enoyl-CoA hydratase-related protein [Nannocystis pusilla]|uniref:Enoyl-CoA hydratase-related protein n=1 Tax=Nannocystis pusilla TaxID=889268 RepID=A0A9X3ENF1_9BACT|nr:enoyl-CoA hydratase-related protein [Nannocystis pusilla]MCY1006901.1 enoyl-CoA hydratase-related protein [Nannocystis pusilla]
MNAHVQTDSLVEVTLERDGVAVLTMRDAAGKNAFGRAFVATLTRALEDLGRRADVRVVVIAGLPEVFSAGGDRDVLLGLADGTIAPYDLLLTRALLEVPVPTIAAMAGPAVGGGLVFGLACDMVVMARESRYGANFMDLGFTPGMGATRLVQFAFGEYVGAEMLYGSQYFRGEHWRGAARSTRSCRAPRCCRGRSTWRRGSPTSRGLRCCCSNVRWRCRGDGPSRRRARSSR